MKTYEVIFRGITGHVAKYLVKAPSQAIAITKAKLLSMTDKVGLKTMHEMLQKLDDIKVKIFKH